MVHLIMSYREYDHSEEQGKYRTLSSGPKDRLFGTHDRLRSNLPGEAELSRFPLFGSYSGILGSDFSASRIFSSGYT